MPLSVLATVQHRALYTSLLTMLTHLVMLSLCLLPAELRADGKGFSKLAAESVQTADQRAAIVWEKGREKLVIETGLQTKSDSVAWVIPVPSTPKVQKATKGTFPTLSQWFTPKINDEPALPNLVIGCIAAGALCILIALRITRQIRTFSLVLAAPFLLIFASLLLPAPSNLASNSVASGIEIHDRQTVGHYEVTTVTGDSATALIDWLDKNDYKIPKGAKPVISDYLAQDWVFVAAQLQRDDTGDSYLAPHPLELSFKAERCVYPMALTGAAQEEPIKLELFVFGDQQAIAPPLRVQSTLTTQRPNDGKEASFQAFPDTGTELEIRHTYLTGLISIPPGKSRVATHLTGTLSPSQMRNDLTLDFKPAQFQRAERYTSAAIAGRSAVAAVIIFGLGILILAIVARTRNDLNLLYHSRPILYLLLLTVIGATTVYTHFSQKRGRATSVRPGVMGNIHHVVSNLLEKADWESGTNTLGPTQVRKKLDIQLPKHIEKGHRDFPLPQELDAPGHYTIHSTNQRIQVFTYGYDGAPHLAWSYETQN